MTCADGIILLDKPGGLSSFTVVAEARRALAHELRCSLRGPQRLKCGHAGTLDPLATGLLILLCGRGVRLSPFLTGLDKTYCCTVRFGVSTDTLDAEGRPDAHADVRFDPPAVSNALARFRGEIAQVPPIYSALKRRGQPLYRAARAGKPVAEPAARTVRIASLELLAARWGGVPGTDARAAQGAAGALAAPDGRIYEVDLRIVCSSGTYVRSLARDLARELGSVGHVSALRRERVGPFVVGDALASGAVRNGAALAAAVRPLARALPHLRSVTLDPLRARLVREGRRPDPAWLGSPLVACQIVVLDAAGDLVALVTAGGGAGADVRLDAVFPERPAGANPPGVKSVEEGDQTCG